MSVSVVPWYNSKEWRDVFKHIYEDDTAEQNKGLWHLRAWKARCPVLPGGIECTLGFLHILCKHGESTHESMDVMRFAYCTAVMRFVNIMLDNEHVRTRSMFYAAKNMGIPQWIVNLRHDVSHNHSIPTLEVLHDAAVFGMQWLKENYWSKQECSISDYVLVNVYGHHSATKAQVDYIKSLIRIYISICTLSQLSNAYTFGDIQDKKTGYMFLTEAKEFLGDKINTQKPRNIIITNVEKMLADTLKKILNKTKNIQVVVAHALADEDSLLLSEDIVNMFNVAGVNDHNSLCDEYLNCFKGILTLVHTKDALHHLVDILLKMVKNDAIRDNRRKLCALWLQQIFHALHKSNLYIAKFNITKGDHIQMTKNMEISFAHWFPNESRGLSLDLSKPPPKQLTDLSYVRPFITTYNPYLRYFIRDMLILVRPSMTLSNINYIIKLCEIFTTESLSPIGDKIYTVKDLEKVYGTKISDDEEMELNIAEDSADENNKVQEIVGGSVWKIASTDTDWACLPIGHAFFYDAQPDTDQSVSQDEGDEQCAIHQDEIMDDEQYMYEPNVEVGVMTVLNEVD